MRIRLFLAVCACSVAIQAHATPTVYQFEGYISSRQNAKYSAPNLSRAFSSGEQISGTFTYDPERRLLDTETGEMRPSPIIAFSLAVEGGSLEITNAASGAGQFRAGGFEILNLPLDDGEVLANDELFFGSTSLGWTALDTGQLPQDSNNVPVDLAALDPNKWQLTVSTWTTCGPQCSGDYVTQVNAHVTALWKDTAAATYTFDSSAQGWTPALGTWDPIGGYYYSSSNMQAAISLASATSSNSYAIDASVYLEWSNTGNRAGLVYDYQNAQNYRGVLFTRGLRDYPDVPARAGAIEVFEVRNGVRRIVFTQPLGQGPGPTIPPREWVPIGVQRTDTVTRISAPGSVITLNQPLVAGSKSVGLLASYNKLRFDDAVLSVSP